MATKLHDSVIKQRRQVQAGFNKLTDELNEWYKQNNLEPACALEMFMSDIPNRIQRDYLAEFIERWDMLEQLDHRLYKMQHELEMSNND